MTTKPKGLSEHVEQLRPPIVRGAGSTESERYLARLGEKSFLNLWSYPNAFRDQRDNPRARQGKELCDLLVVCAPHVILFSEKTIAWQVDRATAVAWSRWFRAAVADSVKQIRGAERWLTNHPDRIYLDPACERLLPIELPPPRERIIHRVVVAQGAAEACRRYFGRGRGSLHISPQISGTSHFESIDGREIEPFYIGDLDPHEPFVHVLDEASLDVVMSELDTITDFTTYLEKKETFIRSGRLRKAEGEENLVAYYAVNINERGDHDFTHPRKVSWSEGEAITIDKENYNNFALDPQYIAKKKAEEDSYVWDRLIEVFTKPLLDGTSLVPLDQAFDIQKSEIGVRQMALVSRFGRRSHSRAVLGAFEKGRTIDRFFRMMIDRGNKIGSDTGFFILILNYLDWMDKWGYDNFRKKRAYLAEVYAKAILAKVSSLKHVVGIAMEAPGRGKGGSEQLLYCAQKDWSDRERADITSECERLSIFTSNMKETPFSEREYPIADVLHLESTTGDRLSVLSDDPLFKDAEFVIGSLSRGATMNRAQRRRAKAQSRAKKKPSDWAKS